MRNLLLVSVATVGLFAGASYTYAQSNRMPGQPAEQSQAPEGGRGQPSQHTAPSPRQQGVTAPAERRPETTGQAPAQHDERHVGPENGAIEHGMKGDRERDMKGDRERPAARQAPEHRRDGKDETTGQAPNDRRDGNRETTQAPNDRRDGNRETTEGPNREVTGQAGRGAAALTPEQRTKIRTTILRERVAPVTNVNFNINVGVVVPRTVEVHPLPAEIVEIEPVWRGYMFFLVGDEIVIVDPSMRIVSMLPA